MTSKLDTLQSFGLQGKGEFLEALDSRYNGVVAPATERVRNALIGAGLNDVVIEADTPQAAPEAPVHQGDAAGTANILRDSVEFTPAPYLEQPDVPVAHTVMQQTVSNPEYN